MNRDQARDELRMYLEDYLVEFHEVQNTRRNFRCLNPEHEDNNPSMGFDRTHNRVHCFSCGASYDIIDLIKLDMGMATDREAFAWGYEHYGIDADTGMTNGNVRSAVVDYAGGSNGEVATNPCIRYPEENIALGIDPSGGLKTKIFSGTETIINSQDLLNLYDPLHIFVCDPSSGNPLGALVIGGE